MSKVWQPLDPDFVHKIVPEYVEFHKTHLLHRPREDQLPWDPAYRLRTSNFASDPLAVGSVVDYEMSKCKLRVFTPSGDVPAAGWPVIIYFHGGGWTLGTINTENVFCTNMCERAKCVVVSVDYRLAPEDPYPAAVEDAVAALEWVIANKTELKVNINKIATGGSSSGGNLAAILTHKAALMSPPVKLMFQLLLVPVIDNTDTETGEVYKSWKENEKTVWLAPARMLWFRNKYLPNMEDRAKWDSSPIFAPDESFAKVPNAWIALGELDVLRDEGIAYGEKLKRFGKEVEIAIYKGAPHHILGLDGSKLDISRRYVSDAVAALSKAFGTA